MNASAAALLDSLERWQAPHADPWTCCGRAITDPRMPARRPRSSSPIQPSSCSRPGTRMVTATRRRSPSGPSGIAARGCSTPPGSIQAAHAHRSPKRSAQRTRSSAATSGSTRACKPGLSIDRDGAAADPLPPTRPAGHVAAQNLNRPVRTQGDRRLTAAELQLLARLDHVRARLPVDDHLHLRLGRSHRHSRRRLGHRGQAHDHRRVRAPVQKPEQDRSPLGERSLELRSSDLADRACDRRRPDEIHKADPCPPSFVDRHDPAQARLTPRDQRGIGPSCASIRHCLESNGPGGNPATERAGRAQRC